MKKTIKQLIEEYIKEGFTLTQAKNITAQYIILSKIEKSPFVDSILLKGGIVMYNITHERRRTTTDLDFDFIRYSISKDKDIEYFVNVLNKEDSFYEVKIIGEIEQLHQLDYHGKRVKLMIKDKSESIKFKLDIGVHTLLAINQEKMCFSFGQENDIALFVNPPEQIIAEKLFSLAKIGPTSVRYKDIDDMFYLIKGGFVDINLLRKCLELLTLNSYNDLVDIQDVVDTCIDILGNKFFIEGYKKSRTSWLNEDYENIKSYILDYLYKI